MERSSYSHRMHYLGDSKDALSASALTVAPDWRKNTDKSNIYNRAYERSHANPPTSCLTRGGSDQPPPISVTAVSWHNNLNRFVKPN